MEYYSAIKSHIYPSNLNAPKGFLLGERKSVLKGYRLQDSMYITLSKGQNYSAENRSVPVARLGGRCDYGGVTQGVLCGDGVVLYQDCVDSHSSLHMW